MNNDLRFIPIGTAHLTPMQKKEKIIKELKRRVKVSVLMNILYTILFCLIVYNKMIGG